MHTQVMRFAAKLFIVFFISLVISFIFEGIVTSPMEGDSLAYHIPIADSILTGNIIHPKFPLGYYPATAHVFLSVLQLFSIPLNLYNPLALVVLFFVAIQFGKTFGVKNDFAIIFAVSICSLHTIIRWMPAQIIDIWLLIFFLQALTLLESLGSTRRHVLFLGVFLGLLIGVKYSGPLYAFILCLVYRKKLRTYITGKSFLMLLVPVLVLGLSWYIRNYSIMGNPVYPQAFLFFPGKEQWQIFSDQVWRSIIRQPFDYFNALLAEYMGWGILILSAIFLLAIKFFNTRTNETVKKLLIIGFANFSLYLLLPTSADYNVVVSSFRYSYPAVIPLILVVFLIAQQYKKEEILILFSAANLFILPSLAYRPKLIFIVLPLVIAMTFFEKYQKKLKIKM